jgi:outer membrane murein-binding lipoprotein Lpp
MKFKTYKFLLLGIITFLFILSGCTSNKAAISQIKPQVDDVRLSIDDLRTSITELKSQVDNFSDGSSN